MALHWSDWPERVRDTLTLPGLSAEGLLMEGVRRIDELRVDADPASGIDVDAMLEAYAAAFRDIFATAGAAGAAGVLQEAARSMLEDDPAHAELFGPLRLGPLGELPVGELAKHVDDLARRKGVAAETLLGDGLATLTLSLLFVAGEPLHGEVHRALHDRVKAHIAPGRSQ